MPQLPGYAWRPMRLEDAAALAEFELACSALDGATQPRSRQDWEAKLADGAHAAANSLIAAGEGGRVAAAGWIDYRPRSEVVHAYLDGRVHPELRGRGIGTALLGWMEERARQQLAAVAEGRRRVLRILFYDRGPDAVALFEAHGFEFAYAEEEMRYDLRTPPPDYPLPAGTSVHPYRPENAADFYRVYADAFRTRTPSTWSEAAWREHFANEADGEFLPELSLLVKAGAQPVAYAVCHLEPAGERAAGGEVWITQMGVRPAWRGRGVGSALLAALLRRFVAAAYGTAAYDTVACDTAAYDTAAYDTVAYDTAVLSVNVNNPEAQRLYRRLGFVPGKRFSVYRKPVAG